MLDSGMTAPAIARKLGVTKSSVYGWFRDAGKPVDSGFNNTLAQKTRDFLSVEDNYIKVKSDLDLGITISEVSRKYGINRLAMYKHPNLIDKTLKLQE